METKFDSPYIGLQPYTVEDQKYFFGRARDSRIISSNLFATPLTVFYGASGVGKSSALQAGVIPLLRKSPRTAVVSFQRWPEKDPVKILKEECLKAIHTAGYGNVQVDTSLDFDEFLFQAANAFHGTILILLDQFEEYFLYHRDAESTFDAEFARAVNREEIDAHFLIALREDSLSMLDRFNTRIPNMLGNSLRLRHLDESSAREAICQPLEVYNQEHPDQPPVSIEEDLVKVLIRDVRAGKLLIGQGGQGCIEDKNTTGDSSIRIETPFLQLILTRLWDEEKKQGSNALRLETLNKLQGASKIVQTHLDHAMKDLPQADQDIAANIFRYLVTPSGTKIAYTVEDLSYYAKSQSLKSVLEKLAGNVRILRKVTLPGEPSRYEIYHDVLGAAILDWRVRYEADKEQALQHANEQKQKLEQNMIRWSVVGSLVEIFFLFILPVGASVIKYGLRRQQPPLNPIQIKSISRNWLLVSLATSIVFLGATFLIGSSAVSGSAGPIILFLIGFGPSMIGKLVAAPYFAFRKYQKLRTAEETKDVSIDDGITSPAVAVN